MERGHPIGPPFHSPSVSCFLSFAREGRRFTFTLGWPYPCLQRCSLSASHALLGSENLKLYLHRPPQTQLFKAAFWASSLAPGIPLCTPTPTNHHTASSTNNLDIPDVTVLVFRDKPPHFALAQRGQATCPRSHSKAGAQLCPLTPSPVFSWGLLEIANSISLWVSHHCPLTPQGAPFTYPCSVHRGECQPLSQGHQGACSVCGGVGPRIGNGEARL